VTWPQAGQPIVLERGAGGEGAQQVAVHVNRYHNASAVGGYYERTDVKPSTEGPLFKLRAGEPNLDDNLLWSFGELREIILKQATTALSPLENTNHRNT
jgi:hypothetical protein